MLVVRQNQQLDDTRTQAAEMSEILRAGDAQVLTLDEWRGRPDDRGDVAGRWTGCCCSATSCRTRRAGHDFQVWSGHDGTMVSAGLLTPDHGEALLAVDGFGDADQIAVTVEPDGGSTQPTTDPVMAVDLPTA